MPLVSGENLRAYCQALSFSIRLWWVLAKRTRLSDSLGVATREVQAMYARLAASVLSAEDGRHRLERAERRALRFGLESGWDETWFRDHCLLPYKERLGLCVARDGMMQGI